MKIRFFTPLSLGVSAMLIATCGYAGAQTTPQDTQTTQQTRQTAEQPMTGNNQVATPDQNATVPPNTKLVSVNATLEDGLNSKDATQGQTVKAKLTDSAKTENGMKLDKGTVLLGKVEQVQKSSNSGPSKISVTFDQAKLKDGRTVPVKATLLAAYPPSAGNYYPADNSTGMTISSQKGFISPDRKVVQQPGTLGNVAMHSAVRSNTSGTFTSPDRNINLKSGTRLQIAVAPASSGTMG